MLIACKPACCRAAVWLLLVVVLLLPAPAPGGDRVLVRDEAGRQVRLSPSPRRIVTLMPSLTEVVFALGLGRRLVGVAQYSDYPPAAKRLPRVGSYVSPNLERIVALAPELVLASKDGNPAWMVDRLAAMGIAVYVTAPGRPQDLPASLARLGRVCGAPAAGRVLARRLEQSFRRVARRLKGVRPVPVLMVIGSHPLISVGRGTINHYLVRMAGGRNIAAAAPGRWPKLSLEYVLQARPRVVVVSTMERGQHLRAVMDYWRSLPGLAGNPGYRVASIQSDLIDRPGPRLGTGLVTLARILHPERFPRAKAGP